MVSAERDEVLTERILSHLQHVSKLLSWALTLCCVTVLAFMFGKQSFEVFDVKLTFTWASIITLIAVLISYFLAASSLHTILNTVRRFNFMDSTNTKEENQGATDLAQKLMTTTVLFNPFSLLGNHPKLLRQGIREETYGPFLMLMLTSITPLLVIQIVSGASLSELLEPIIINQYVDFALDQIFSMVVGVLTLFTYIYYMLMASTVPYELIGGRNRRIWYFFIPLAIHVGVNIVWDAFRLGKWALQWMLQL